MKRLPSIVTRPLPAAQHERLERWLGQWQVDRVLAAAAGPRPEPASLPTDRDTTRPVPGAIWLLHPATVPHADRPVYIAILHQAAVGEDRWVAAPFSRFGEPALPGEWLTGRPEPPLRVLCAWNSACLPAAVIQQGWPVDELTATQHDHARAAWNHVHRDTPLPPALTAQVGPPLVHPLDPRWEYCDEEALLLTPSMPDLSASNMVQYPTAATGRADDLARAAETRGPYQVTTPLAPTGLELVLLARPVTDADRVRLTAVDRRGQPSGQVDGARIENTAGDQSDPIRDGQAEIPASWLATDLVLVMPDGTRHRLQPPQ